MDHGSCVDPDPTPDPETQAFHALCRMAAALDVLELHIRHRSTAINCACRDLLRLYYAEAEQALERKGDVLGMLRGIALNLGHAIEVVDQLNCHGADDTILHAVGFLLKAARRLVDEALVGALP